MQLQRASAAARREGRRPTFPLAGTMVPFGLYPVMAHPVLPGETMDYFALKLRAISMPIKYPLGGAWLETWLCYVKFTDIDRSLGEMFISDTVPTTGYVAGDSERYFSKGGQIDWMRVLTERVHEAYFLNGGDTARTIDGVPQTKIVGTDWTQNLMFKPAEVDAADLPSNPDAQLTGFQMMQMMNMSEMTYEKYLQQFGVQTIRSAVGDPEILRYSRSWTLPTNVVAPTTGVPSSAWSWSDEIKSEKPKRFDEPGFLVLFASVRPKVYKKHLASSVVGTMWGFADWFPVYNLEDPAGGIRQILSSDTVFDPAWREGAASSALLYDHRDVLSHGETFVNNRSSHPYALPWVTGQNAGADATAEELRGDYALLSDIQGMFVGETAQGRCCYYEGIADVRIRGHIKDTTL